MKMPLWPDGMNTLPDQIIEDHRRSGTTTVYVFRRGGITTMVECDEKDVITHIRRF
jgi:uncharacterized protein YbaA (DUF1428 family)